MPVVHARPFLTVRFDEQGIELRPWPGRPIRIDWREVEFVCPVPAMERRPDGWYERPNSLLPEGFRSTLASAGLQELNVVVRDRRPIVARAGGWFSRAWISSELRPMLDAEDRLQEDQSLLRLELRRRALGGSVTPLLDLLAEHCRFDLVVDSMRDDAPFDLPSSDELGRGAIDLLERHFAAINAGDREAFRETAYLFEANDGLPFERWWSGMRSLAPLSVALTLGSVDSTLRERREPHLRIRVRAVAQSAATTLRYSDDFVVWYLVGSRRWKLGCRHHWWLKSPAAAP